MNGISRAVVERVTTTWLKLAATVDFDMLCRAQVLEGVLGKSLVEGQGPHPGRAGLVRALEVARDFFASTGDRPDPLWLTVQDTGMYTKVLHNLGRTLTKHGLLDSHAEVVMQHALAGLSLDSVLDRDLPVQKTVKPFVAAGAKHADGIRNGRVTPLPFASGTLSTYLGRKALNEIRREHTRQEIGIPSPDLQDVSGLVFAMILFGKDALTKKLHTLMRASWAGKNEERLMNAWLDLVERSGRLPTASEVVEKVGLSGRPGLMRFSDQWGQAMPRFFAQLKRSRILWEIDARLAAMGVDTQEVSAADVFADPNKTYGNFKRWKPNKYARAEAAYRLASLWLTRHGL